MWDSFANEYEEIQLYKQANIGMAAHGLGNMITMGRMAGRKAVSRVADSAGKKMVDVLGPKRARSVITKSTGALNNPTAYEFVGGRNMPANLAWWGPWFGAGGAVAPATAYARSGAAVGSFGLPRIIR